MNLKHLFFSLVACLFATMGAAAPTTPQFSTDDTEHWYYIIFAAGDNALYNNGVDNSLTTRMIEKNLDGELWKFVGTPESFTLQSKRGNYAGFNGNYVHGYANASDAKNFRLVASTLVGYEDCWEIEYPDKGDEWNRWNQWGGAGVGKRIGLYTPGDGGNAVRFLTEDEIPEVSQLTKLQEFPTSQISDFTPEHRHTIWFGKPATAETVGDTWMEFGLPIGNGDFGAMTFGGIAQDRIQFNDKSLWTGSPTTRGCYQNFGDLYIEDISGVFGEGQPAANYVRYLDMDEGKVTARYTSPDGNTSYSREYIASYPDKVVAIKLGSSAAGKISVRLRLFNGIKKGFLAPVYSENTISMDGKLDYIDFKAKVKVMPTGGTSKAEKDYLEINGADEILVILAGATNFDPHSPNYLSGVEEMKNLVDMRAENGVVKGWDSLLANHTADYQSLFGRVDFCIDGAANDRSTRDIVARYNGRGAKRTEGCNLMLEELYYAYGRYLLIGSSRGMDSPANLQGIWNHSDNPAWQCDIHSNINVQMNYWPAEPTNLSELHAPFLNYIHSMVTEHPQWRQYAKNSGQTVGFTCYTQNNIFGHSDYAENYVVANAWYVSHLWQHYLYTLDKEFLKDRALPLMAECCEYWMERLVEASDGSLVAPKEWSPEHGPAEEDGTAHAQQIVANLFQSTLKALEILGDEANVKASFASTLAEKYAKLDKGLATEVYNGWGTSNGVGNGDLVLREWKYSDITAGENQHRHQSHLMALYPYSDITPETEWFVPAVNSLKQRGDISTGWSLAWRICLWARALDGEHASSIIKSALRHASSYGQSSGAGGIYYNLLDSHAPFQIDGNFGYTTGVTEMLLQSYGGTLRFLPALPELWAGGHINGLRAEGNFEVDQRWSNCKLESAVVKSFSGTDCKIKYPQIAKATITDANGVEVNFTANGDDEITFPTAANGIYTIITVDYTGVEGVEAINNAAPEYYNLQGVRVANPQGGIFIVREGNKVSKKVIR